MRGLIAGIVGVGFLIFGLFVGTHNPTIGYSSGGSSSSNYDQVHCGGPFGEYPAARDDAKAGIVPKLTVSPCVERRDHAWMLSVGTSLVGATLLICSFATRILAWWTRRKADWVAADAYVDQQSKPGSDATPQ